MSTFSASKKDAWWLRARPGLAIGYLVIALALLALSTTGHQRLLSERGDRFGGFFWAIDTDAGGGVVVVSSAADQPPFDVKANSLTSTTHIIAINGLKGAANFTKVYQKLTQDTPVTYTIARSDNTTFTITRPTTLFTTDM
ncbi:MAG TPA: hypothetical protein VGU68_15325, partial [Ktedonobacteraceae bacterium]|nr:hypothetical protein [Ktedonobacteraceae bacterium]